MYERTQSGLYRTQLSVDWGVLRIGIVRQTLTTCNDRFPLCRGLERVSGRRLNYIALAGAGLPASAVEENTEISQQACP